MKIPCPIDGLFDLAAQLGVRIKWYPCDSCPRGKYKSIDGINIIFLSPILRRSEMRLRCTLAHELGHHVTGVGAEAIGGDIRDEARARRWARHLLMPDEWIRERLDLPVWEIAEQAGVYQEWAAARIRDMERALLYV